MMAHPVAPGHLFQYRARSNIREIRKVRTVPQERLS